MSGAVNWGAPRLRMGPVETGFRAAHKARAARFTALVKAASRSRNDLLLNNNLRLVDTNKTSEKLARENASWRDHSISANRPPVRLIIAARARQFGIGCANLTGHDKYALFVEARQATMHDVRDLWPELSYPAIARLLGRRDHTTIMHGVRRHQARIDAGTARPRPPLVAP